MRYAPPSSQPVIDWSDYGLWEYLLVAHPTEDVTQTIAAEKQQFAKTYATCPTVKTHPHIAIANFLGKTQMEATLLRWIQNICNQHTPFHVTLQNFSGFVPHTIYIQIKNTQPFKQLAKSLLAIDHFIKANDCPPLKLSATPHLTIARGLPEPVYFKAFLEYAQRPFLESFAVSNLTLLKRTSLVAACQTVKVFPLLPQPISVI